MNEQNTSTTMDIHEVLEYLPHRYPFLLIDRVVDIQLGKSIRCFKNVTYNEPFFLGHFRYHPVMPGVLLIEAMAQACGILAFKTLDIKPDDKHVFYLVGVDKVRFRHPVFPGDKVMIESRVIKSKRNMWKFSTVVFVEEKEICSAEVLCCQKSL